MRRGLGLLLAVVGGLASQVPVHPAEAQPAMEASASFGTFYEALSPYGEWMDYGDYGYVWRPSAAYVGTNFRPYATGGRWVYTDYGWSFESDYPWGWATFHYGRWAYDPDLGWIWIPGTVWGPSWVDWRYGGGYVGWAPLPPVGWSFGLGVGIGFFSSWCFVPSPFFVRPNVFAFAVPPSRVQFIFPHTQRVDVFIHGRFPAGPPVQRISNDARVVIQPTPVRALPSTEKARRFAATMPSGSSTVRPEPSVPPATQGRQGTMRPSPSTPSSPQNVQRFSQPPTVVGPSSPQPQVMRPAPSQPAPQVSRPVAPPPAQHIESPPPMVHSAPPVAQPAPSMPHAAPPPSMHHFAAPPAPHMPSGGGHH